MTLTATAVGRGQFDPCNERKHRIIGWHAAVDYDEEFLTPVLCCAQHYGQSAYTERRSVQAPCAHQRQ